MPAARNGSTLLGALLQKAEDLLFRYEGRVAAFLAFLYLVPIWSVAVFPSQDGGGHLHSSIVIRDLRAGGPSFYENYYELDKPLYPYQTLHIFLGVLTKIVSPETAEKVLVSICVLSLFFAMRYALRSLGHRWIELSWLCLPLAYDRYLHIGLYNFMLAGAGAMFLLGYWLRGRCDGSLRSSICFTAMTLLLYYTHVFFSTWLVLSIFLWMSTHWLIAATGYLAGKPTLGMIRAEAAEFFQRTMVPIAPLLVLTFDFSKSYVSDNLGSREFQVHPGFTNFIDFDWLWSFGEQDRSIMRLLFYGLTFLLIAAAYTKLKDRRLGRDDKLLGILLPALAGFTFSPETDWLSYRLILPITLTAILWVGSIRFDKTVRLAFCAVLLWMSASYVPFLVQRYRQINEDIEEYLSIAPLLEPDHTLLTVSTGHLDRSLCAKVQPYRHLGSMLAAKRGLVSLNNFEGFMAYLPLHYRKTVNPYTNLNSFVEGEPPIGLDLINYPSRTQGEGSIDYVAVWTPHPGSFQEEHVRKFLLQLSEQLQGRFKLIQVSKNQKMRLYEREGRSKGGVEDGKAS